MAINRNNWAIIFIDRDRFDYFSSTIKSTITFPFGKEAVLDLEVVNSDLLNQQVKSLIDNNKLYPSFLTIILSPGITFEKTFFPSDNAKTDLEISQFLESIPFDEISEVRYPIEKGLRVIVSNKELFREIARAFEEKDFQVNTVIAGAGLNPSVSSLNEGSVYQIIDQIESLKRFSFSSENTIAEIEAKKTTEGTKKREKLLLSSFAGLISLAIILVMKAFGVF